MILAELGARVIKVEQPGSGDETRGFEPQLAQDSAYYFACNRSKESITVNLRSDEGKKIIRELGAEGRRGGRELSRRHARALRPRLRQPFRAEPEADLRLLHRLRPDRALRATRRATTPCSRRWAG